MEVRPTSLTAAWTNTTSPTWTAWRKLIWSRAAVTTGPPAWRLAAIPAAVSISFMISPPCTLPMTLAWVTPIAWERVTADSRRCLALGGLPGRLVDLLAQADEAVARRFRPVRAHRLGPRSWRDITTLKI